MKEKYFFYVVMWLLTRSIRKNFRFCDVIINCQSGGGYIDSCGSSFCFLFLNYSRSFISRTFNLIVGHIELKERWVFFLFHRKKCASFFRLLNENRAAFCNNKKYWYKGKQPTACWQKVRFEGDKSCLQFTCNLALTWKSLPELRLRYKLGRDLGHR